MDTRESGRVRKADDFIGGLSNSPNSPNPIISYQYVVLHKDEKEADAG